MLPIGNITIPSMIVNDKTAICIAKIDFKEIEINDLLENINILINYILKQKIKKVKHIKFPNKE